MTSVSSDIGSALLFGVLAFAFLWIGRKKGLLSLQNQQASWAVPLKWHHVLLAFGIYFAVAIFISPWIATWLRPHHFSGSALDFLKVSSWLNFLNSLLILSFLALYFFRLPSSISLSILSKQRVHFLQNIWIALLYWLLSCPLILFINHLLDLFTSLFFRVEQLPEQLAVHFLKMTFHHPLYFSLALITIIALAPLIEELLFRGFLQSYIRSRLGSSQAILATSLCFAFFHYSPEQGVGNIPIIGSLFAFALFLGLIYEKQKSLAAPIALHATFNAVNVFSLYFLGGTPPL